MIKAELTTPLSPPILCRRALVNDINMKIHCYDVGIDIIYLYWHGAASSACGVPRKCGETNRGCRLTLCQLGSSQGLSN